MDLFVRSIVWLGCCELHSDQRPIRWQSGYAKMIGLEYERGMGRTELFNLRAIELQMRGIL